MSTPTGSKMGKQMSDYTPNLATIESAYVNWALLADRGIDASEAAAECDRFIAKVKADALREAAEDMDNTDDPDAIHIANGDADLWLKARADRIEREA